MEFIKSLDDYLEQTTSSDMPFIICGDLNINTIEDNLIKVIGMLLAQMVLNWRLSRPPE